MNKTALLDARGNPIEGRASPENPSTSLSNPAQWLTDWMGGQPSASGISINRESSIRISAVYACVRVIAETAAGIPLHVLRERKSGRREKVTQHRVVDFFEFEPNEFMTPVVYRETKTGHAALLGNGYSLIDRNGRGEALGLLPLQPHMVEPQRMDSKLVYKVDGEFIPAKDILHIPALGYDGVRGYNPIELARQGLGLALATEEHGARLFGNGTRLSGVLEHPGKVTKEAADRLKSSWQAMYAGLGNAHRTAVLEEGMKFNTMTMNQDDAQFLETRKFQVSEIARMFRVPPHMIGDLERATFSNIEHQGLEFVKYTLMPWLIRWEQEIKRKLLGRGDLYVKHNLAGLLRGDTKSRYEAYGRGIQDGWLTRNEARDKEDLDPIDGLDEPLQPLNMVPAGQQPPTEGEGNENGD